MSSAIMPTRPQPVNPYANVGTVLRDLRVQFADDKPRFTAINRAALNIVACNWAVWPDGIQIQSATNARRYYHVTDSGCDCPASGVCWHMAALDLLRALGHIAPADDWQDDDLGAFTEDDGFCSRLENRMRRICGADAVLVDTEAKQSIIIGTPRHTPDVFRELPLDTDNATYHAHLGRFSSMTEDEINADLF